MSDNNPGPIVHTATVMETMSSAGYTYIRVEEKGKIFWIALHETQVSVGEKVSFYEQMLMENFTSKSLNRTFDRILFVEAINRGTDLPTKDKAKPSQNIKPPEQHAEAQNPKELATPVGRFTIKEIFEKKDDLVGKVVEVKGKISKLSSQIMGRDWVHIEDGTGAKQENNNKIIFRTTQVGLAVGDEVVGKGVLYVNKDFGYGYFYPLIIEDAVFSK
ncbi:MAG: DNA-binding protein [gamma proteobacterium symbiont of Ctena orbiculata]|nr:MAG: DNA-binding protein [gamma proteobacterium symbiont of Ctena orbiculata]